MGGPSQRGERSRARFHRRNRITAPQAMVGRYLIPFLQPFDSEPPSTSVYLRLKIKYRFSRSGKSILHPGTFFETALRARALGIKVRSCWPSPTPDRKNGYRESPGGVDHAPTSGVDRPGRNGVTALDVC